MSKELEIVNKKFINKKWHNLFLGILFDFIGMISYFIPGAGEYIDIIWAPMSFYFMISMYKGFTGKVAGIISFIEEAFPFFIDIIPTFTLTWIYKYFIRKED